MKQYHARCRCFVELHVVDFLLRTQEGGDKVARQWTDSQSGMRIRPLDIGVAALPFFVLFLEATLFTL